MKKDLLCRMTAWGLWIWCALMALAVTAMMLAGAWDVVRSVVDSSCQNPSSYPTKDKLE